MTGNGKNIYPEELETRLSRFPCVGEALVLGTGDAGGVRVRAKMDLTGGYLALKYGDARMAEELPAPPGPEWTADGYRACGRGLSGARRRGPVYRLAGTPEHPSRARLTRFRLPAGQLRRLAQEQGVSVTGYVAALLFLGIRQVQLAGPAQAQRRKIRLSVPVNLRTRLSCRTLQNFSLNVYPEVNPDADSMELPALCDGFRRYMRWALEPGRLAGRCRAYSLAAGLHACRLLPLSFQQRLVRGALDAPSAGSTLTFSSLGALSLPPQMRPYIDEIPVFFSARPGSPYSCAMLTLGDTLCLTLLRTVREPLLEERLEQLFADLRISCRKAVTVPCWE